MEKDVNSPPMSGKTSNETASKTTLSSLKTTKNEIRHRPNRPGWILKRANTISLCFSRDNHTKDKNSVYDLSISPNESISEVLHHPSSEQSVMKFTRSCWQKNNDPIKSFCRGSLKKLRNAESKVILAKKDVEDILIQSDNDSKEIVFDPPIRRLEEDTIMLSEVQQEINHLISEFSSLVTEEEERIVKKAKILEKHNSCTEFKQVSYTKMKANDLNDEDGTSSMKEEKVKYHSNEELNTSESN